LYKKDESLVGLVSRIINNIRQGVLVIDDRNRILDINEKALKILDLKESNYKTIDVSKLFRESLPKKTTRKTYTLRDDRKIKIRFVCEQKNKAKYRVLYIEKTKKMLKKDILESILNSIDEAIMACDENGYMTLYNKATQELDGIIKEKVIGRHVTKLYNLTEETSLMMQAMKQERSFIDTHQTYITYTGKRLNIVCNTYPLYQEGEVIGGVSIIRDNSKIQELLEEIVDLRESVSKKSKKVESKKPTEKTKYRFSNIIGSSSRLRETIKYAKKAARSDSSVLIYGETGTGKELFSQSIHDSSDRRGKPFVAINCAAIPENLLEGLLFGTEKGAFSGAIERPGLFEQAQEGTLLLDEINSMPLGLQSKLLRALQEGRIRRLGAVDEKSVDVRVISNINIKPSKAINENKLRQDLFYRLSGVSLEIPPLRERKEDIPILTNMFINKYNKKIKMKVTGMSSKVLDIFNKYCWPGNVRELEHSIETALNIMGSNESMIFEKHIPFHIIDSIEDYKKDMKNISEKSYNNTLSETLNLVEKQLLINALDENGWNISHAADNLGIHRQALQYRIKKHNIKK